MTLDRVQESGFAPRFARQVYHGLSDDGHLSADEAALFEASVGKPETMTGGINWYRANVPDFESQNRLPQWPRHNRPISAPLLLIWGSKDTTFASTFLDDMRRYSTNLTLVTIPDVGHMTPIENSDKSSIKIGEFLSLACASTKNGSC